MTTAFSVQFAGGARPGPASAPAREDARAGVAARTRLQQRRSFLQLSRYCSSAAAARVGAGAGGRACLAAAFTVPWRFSILLPG